MITTIRVYKLAIKYWLQGDSWESSYNLATYIVKTWTKGVK